MHGSLPFHADHIISQQASAAKIEPYRGSQGSTTTRVRETVASAERECMIE